MALTEQELLKVIDDNLPDNSYLEIGSVRDVLKTMVTEIVLLSGGATTLTKDGMTWYKYAGNIDQDNYQLYDIVKGIGTIWPGYYVEAIVKSVGPVVWGVLESEEL